jgi:hypothetical protein
LRWVAWFSYKRLEGGGGGGGVFGDESDEA